MAVDVWPYYWPVQIQDTPRVAYTTRVTETKFGSGYTQYSGDGPNAETREFSISFTGQDNDRWTKPQDVSAFLRAHILTAFLFTPPDGVQGLFTTVPDSVNIVPNGGHVFTVTATLRTSVGF